MVIGNKMILLDGESTLNKDINIAMGIGIDGLKNINIIYSEA